MLAALAGLTAAFKFLYLFDLGPFVLKPFLEITDFKAESYGNIPSVNL